MLLAEESTPGFQVTGMDDCSIFWGFEIFLSRIFCRSSRYLDF